MMLNENAIAMGGGGSFAIYLDSDLHEGAPADSVKLLIVHHCHRPQKI